jgi:hypothetical protein
MRKMIFLIAVFMVCLVSVGGAIAQPNKYWAMDAGNSWSYNGSNPTSCGPAPTCTWTSRTDIGAIDSVTVPGFTTYRLDRFSGDILSPQDMDWYSVNPLSPFDFRWHRGVYVQDQMTVTFNGGLFVGGKQITFPVPLIENTTGTLNDPTFNGPIDVNSTVTVVGFGPVVVPLGTFQAYEVHHQISVSQLGGPVMDRTQWFAPYIGVVKDMEVPLPPTPGDVDTEVLTSLNIATVFSDVPVMSGPTVNIFYQYIMGIYDEGITVGTGPGTYSPLMNVTREQMAAFIVRAKENGQFFEGPCTGPSPFSDVPQDSNFCRNIERLVARGITVGCGGGNYCPSATVTREQMAAFIVRAVEGGQFFEGPCTPPDPSPFPDVSASSTFCRNIAQLVNLGITKGCGVGTYCPGDNVTREQMAAFLARAFLGIP